MATTSSITDTDVDARLARLAEAQRRREERENRARADRERRDRLRAVLLARAWERLGPLEGVRAGGYPLSLLRDDAQGCLTVGPRRPGGLVPVGTLRPAVSPPDGAVTWYVRDEATLLTRTAADLAGALGLLLDLVEPLADGDGASAPAE